MRIALAQIQSGTDPSANLAIVEDYTRRAADAGPAWCCSPRPRCAASGCRWSRSPNRSTGRGPSGVRAIAERVGHRRRRGHVLPERRRPGHQHAGRDRPRRRRALPQDLPLRRLRVHRITHRRTGFRAVVITVDGVGVGLTTCYDIRFPELYVELAQRGAQLITVHASWGSGPGKLDQWTLLARARALDTHQRRRRRRPGLPRRRDRRRRPDRRRRQPGVLAHRRRGGRGGRRPAAAASSTSTSIPSRRPATPSRCCATAPGSLSPVGHNRWGDRPLRSVGPPSRQPAASAPAGAAEPQYAGGPPRRRRAATAGVSAAGHRPRRPTEAADAASQRRAGSGASSAIRCRSCWWSSSCSRSARQAWSAARSTPASGADRSSRPPRSA